jgi:hypothetical protein
MKLTVPKRHYIWAPNTEFHKNQSRIAEIHLRLSIRVFQFFNIIQQMHLIITDISLFIPTAEHQFYMLLHVSADLNCHQGVNVYRRRQ